MAVKLRLKRMGGKQKPFYRIVAADSRFPRDGRFIETVGTYNPIAKPAEVKIDKELAIKWLSNGAQPTDTVKYLMANCNEDGTLNYKKSEVVKLSKKAQAKKAEEEARKAEEAAAAAQTEEASTEA